MSIEGRNYSLHIVEGVEERVDEASCKSEECGKLRFEHVIVMLILPGCEIEILLDLIFIRISKQSKIPQTDLERVLLITQALLLLLSELVQTVVVTVVIHELVVPLHTGLPDLLADIVELLTRLNDAGVDEFELGRQRFWRTSQTALGQTGTERTSHLLHQTLVRRDIPQGDLSLRVFGSKVVLGAYGSEQGR
jgi:hypothetical protein